MLKLAIGRIVPEQQIAVDPLVVRVRIMRLELNRDIYKVSVHR